MLIFNCKQKKDEAIASPFLQSLYTNTLQSNALSILN